MPDLNATSFCLGVNVRMPRCVDVPASSPPAGSAASRRRPPPPCRVAFFPRRPTPAAKRLSHVWETPLCRRRSSAAMYAAMAALSTATLSFHLAMSLRKRTNNPMRVTCGLAKGLPRKVSTPLSLPTMVATQTLWLAAMFGKLFPPKIPQELRHSVRNAVLQSIVVAAKSLSSCVLSHTFEQGEEPRRVGWGIQTKSHVWE